MPEQSPAYLFYPKDILSSGRVSALTPLEELWFRRSLDQSWLHDGLPADPVEFAGWVGRGCTAKSAEKIIATFFRPHKKDTSKVVNPRQEIERAKWRKMRKERSRAGIVSGQSRRAKKSQENAEKNNENYGNGVEKSNTKNQHPDKSNNKNGLGVEQMFDFVQTKDEQKRTIPIPISFPISELNLKRLIERAISENSDKDRKLVEVSVIQTLISRNGSKAAINSMKYFEPEIKKMAGTPERALDAIIETRRKQLEEWQINQERDN